MFSLLWTFSSPFLNASFSIFCSLQQLPLEALSSATLLQSSSSSLTLSSLLSPTALSKWIPLLRWDVRGVAACFLPAEVLFVHWAGVVRRGGVVRWVDVFGGAGVVHWLSAVLWAGVECREGVVSCSVVSGLPDSWFVCWSACDGAEVHVKGRYLGDDKGSSVEDPLPRWSGTGVKLALWGATIVTSEFEEVDDHLCAACAFLPSWRKFCLLCSSSFFFFFPSLSFAFWSTSLPFWAWLSDFFFFSALHHLSVSFVSVCLLDLGLFLLWLDHHSF